ncbi:hypothetical protein Trydic_g23196 [Trypoxylus dichotomus]
MQFIIHQKFSETQTEAEKERATPPCSTIGNTSTGKSVMDTDDFQLPSARRQLKRKGLRNSSSESDRRERPGTKPAKDARVSSVVLREKARWMAVNAELAQQGVRTTKVVKANVGIRIQPASAVDYRQLVRIVSAIKHASCKRMVVGAARRPTLLVFVQLTKSDEGKEIFSMTDVCGMNVTVESKRVKKDQATQCHRCQFYGQGQRHCHAAAVCAKCAGPNQTAECALCSGPHTASYRGCPKSPYGNRREAPTPNPRPVAPKPAPRPVPKKPETRKPQPQTPKEAPTAIETDAPRPTTSTARPSYAAAIKKSATKTVARKPKASGKPKTPAATTGHKPTPKKPETFKPGKPAKPAVAKNPARDVPRTRTARTEAGATSTLALLIPLFQRINCTKVQEVATTLLPQLLACRSGAEAGLVPGTCNTSWRYSSKTELEKFVQRHQLDAILIGETHLRASNRLTLPNFAVYRADREDARGGGTAVLVKSTIEHHADLVLELINIEATAVTINLATGPVKLVAAYKAPRKQLLEEIFDTRGAVILAGDLNAKHPSWNSRRTNASGICLRRYADDLHLPVDATAEPTIFPHNGQSDLLDIVVMKDVAQFHQLTVLNELLSDHNSVLLQRGQTVPEDEEPWTRQTVS